MHSGSGSLITKQPEQNRGKSRLPRRRDGSGGERGALDSISKRLVCLSALEFEPKHLRGATF